MIEKLFPGMTVDKIQDIDLDDLRKRNIRGLILDIDNTLVPNHVAEADDNAVAWIERVKNSGFRVCIVSNASRKRVVKFNERLKIYAIHRAVKPGVKALRKAMRLMETDEKSTALIGDQIFTDVLGGNRLGMLTILVTPLHSREAAFIRFKRRLEKRILAKYRKRSIRAT